MTPAPGPIRAVGVVVPARDEQERIPDCLTALRGALDRLPAGVARAVCLVLDRCTDRTAWVAAAEVRDWPWPVDILHNRSARTVGELRHTGIECLLRGRAPAETWLLSTDADSTVPPDWATGHLRYADAGADAVAGTVTLDEADGLHPDALRRYASVVDSGVTGPAHTHVYAANLGIRGSAYTAVGGFPAVPSGEEHALLRRLRSGGHPIAAPTGLDVRTSARLDGRAAGGLADLLVSLHPR